jgi:hypothetical protein
MPSAPRLDLDAATEETIFAALVQVLRDDDTVARVVKTWEVLDGTSPILEPPRPAEMPHLRLVPGAAPYEVAEAAAYRVDMAVDVLVATEGLHRADQLNLWGAVRAALRGEKPYGDDTVFDFLWRLGVQHHRIAGVQFGPWPPPGRDGGSRAQDLIGTARIVLQFRTPY